MSYKPGDAIEYYFETVGATGVLVNADSLPTAIFYRDGASDAANTPLTVANVTTGLYKVTGTIYASAALADRCNIVASATIATIATAATLDTFLLDSKRVGDLHDINAGAQMDLVNVPNATAIGNFKNGLAGVGVYLTGIMSTALTETGGYLAAAFKRMYNVADSAGNFTVASKNQTVDAATIKAQTDKLQFVSGQSVTLAWDPASTGPDPNYPIARQYSLGKLVQNGQPVFVDATQTYAIWLYSDGATVNQWLLCLVSDIGSADLTKAMYLGPSNIYPAVPVMSSGPFTARMYYGGNGPQPLTGAQTTSAITTATVGWNPQTLPVVDANGKVTCNNPAAPTAVAVATAVAALTIDGTVTLQKALQVILGRSVGKTAWTAATGTWTIYAADGVTVICQATMTSPGVRTTPTIS